LYKGKMYVLRFWSRDITHWEVDYLRDRAGQCKMKIEVDTEVIRQDEFFQIRWELGWYADGDKYKREEVTKNLEIRRREVEECEIEHTERPPLKRHKALS